MGFTIEYVSKKYPKAKIVGLGNSMGANVMLKYVGEAREKSILLGVAAVSCPFDILLCSKAISKTVLPDKFMAEDFVKLLKKNKDYFMPHDLPILLEEALLSKTTRQFDELFTRRIHGYRSPEHYYREVSCVNYLHQITIPVLALSSLDDPVITKDCIPYEEFLHNENLILATTLTGGHLGWFTGFLRPRRVRCM
jgi:predicted alpha/beta-fold hydrolase